MVGVPRSTGCLPCRKAKLKCDEAKPLCGRCTKKGHACIFAERFKFVDETVLHMSEDRVEDDPARQMLAPPKHGIFLYSSEKRTESGGLFQKWHRTTIHASPTTPPAMSSSDILGYNLVKCWEEGPKGMRFDLCAAWFKKLPARLGRSSALDAAVCLLSNVHRLMLADPEPSHWICPASYMKALRCLRHALVDPKEGYAVETLAAAMVLYHVEEKLGNQFHNGIKHAGGIALLLEKRGMVPFQETFDWEVINQIQGPVISNSVILGSPCFLTQPSWMEYLESYEPPSELAALVQEFSLLLAHWPSLTGNIRQIRAGNLSARAFNDTRALIFKLRSRLDALEIVMDEYIDRQEDIVLVPTSRVISPVAQVYDFRTGSAWPALINTHCSFTLILDSMLDFMDQYDYHCNSLVPHMSRRILKADQHERLIEKICRAYEWSTTVRPMMAKVSTLSLSLSYHYSKSEELREWILDALNESESYQTTFKPRFTKEMVTFMKDLTIGATELSQAQRHVHSLGENPYDSPGNTSDGQLSTP